MANEKRLIEANALCEFFQERYEYLRNASRRHLRDGRVFVDREIETGAIIAKEFLDKAKNAPTVDAVEVVHAMWHDVYLMTPWVATGICSRCNSKSYINPDFPWSNYCPHCGAKMDGGNEDG